MNSASFKFWITGIGMLLVAYYVPELQVLAWPGLASAGLGVLSLLRNRGE